MTLPRSWTDPKVLESVVHLYTTVPRAITLHGCLRLALTHPHFPTRLKPIVETMLDHLEEYFREVGLEEPEQGWRYMVPEKELEVKGDH